MTNRYETVFILTPVLSDEQTKEAAKKFRSLVEENGKLHFAEEWGIKKLAYPINKRSTGFYYLFEFEASGAFIQKLETEFKRDERVLRYLTVKMDKLHLAFSERRRKNLKEGKKEMILKD